MVWVVWVGHEESHRRDRVAGTGAYPLDRSSPGGHLRTLEPRQTPGHLPMSPILCPMPRLTNLIPTRFARECTTGGFIDACQDALSSLAEADSSRTALAVFGGVVGGPAAFLGIYAGMAFLQWKRDERQADEAKARARELHRRLGQIEVGVNEQKELAGLLEELLERDSAMRERLERAERESTTPEQAFEALLGPVLTELMEGIEEGFDGVRIYLSNISTWVAEGLARVEANQAVTHEKLDANATKLDASEPIDIEALEMLKRLHEGDHPDVATSLNSLADVREELGRAAEAEPMYVEALEMYKRLYPGDHPAVAMSLNNLAGVRQALGRAAEAESVFVEALEMRRRLFPGDHADVAMSLNNLAGVWETLGLTAEAEPVFVEALEMHQRLFPGNHPFVAMSLSSLAYVRQALGRAAEAEPLYVEALEMLRRLYEGDHPAVATSLNNLAGVRAAQGRWAEALGPSEQAVAMAGRCLPEGHPSRARYEQNLAFIRARLGGG